ncbi:MAG: hypothetical protein HYT80_05235 [Euryarchaeota archaeon]|nr:hypothetical protein [Euryarchaeota archaeon]
MVEWTRLANFTVAILAQGWGKLEAFLGILGVVQFLLTFAEVPWFGFQEALLVLAFLFLAMFTTKIIRQSYRFFLNQADRIRARYLIPGEGVAAGEKIVVLAYNPTVQENGILTLYARSSGAHQALCILSIRKIIAGQQIQAVQESPSPTNLDIASYFNDQSKLKGLYATPLIDAKLLEQFRDYGVR